MESAKRAGLALAFVLALASTGCVDDVGICDAGDLAVALRNALRGDRVRAGECRITGTFTVPGGVTLEGRGQGRTRFVGTEGEPALRLEGGERPTGLVGVSVESSGPAAILARGSGLASIEDVSVDATRGIALGAESLDSVTVTNVVLTGPVTAANADQVSTDPRPEVTATHGLVLVRVGEAELQQVSATGFARFGVLFVESATGWHGGDASNNLATGLMVHAGSALLEDIVICGTLGGMTLVPAYAGVFTAGAEVETRNVTVCDGEDFGLVHDECTADHVDLEITGQTDAALWAQRCPSLSITGSSSIRDNGLAGLVLIEPQEVLVDGTEISATTLVSTMLGETGSIDVADGVQLRDPLGAATFRNLTLEGNERVGFLVDASGGAPVDLTLEGVSATGEGEQLGVLAQGFDEEVGWDDGVTRSPDLAANDEAHVGSLDVLQPVADSDIPDRDAALVDIEDLFR